MGRYEYCDTTLDMLIEQSIEQEWENQNTEPAQPLDSISKENVLKAWAILDVMQEYVYKEVLERIERAAELVNNTPEADKILSLYDELTNIRESIREIGKTLDRNWSERV